MAETIISPGVFLTENDKSQITQGPIAAGAALLGPTVIGPVNIPTVITSYSQYKATFGATFVSGGITQEYLTSIAAFNYFNQGGQSLLITRVASGSYTVANASVLSNIGLTYASASLNLTTAITNPYSASFNGVNVLISGSSAQDVYNNATASINANAIINSTASFATPSLVVTAKTIGVTANSYYYTSGSTTVFYGNGTNSQAFSLSTLSVGTVMNNATGSTVAGSLPSGSSANVRYEIVSSASGSGLFSLNIRRGDDYENSKTVLESWTNLSLDPNQNNYISYVIGDQFQNVGYDPTSGTYYIQNTGSYSNKSNYVYVSNVNLPTPNYFDQTGRPQTQFTGSMPLIGSGSLNGGFNGATGQFYGSFGKASLNMFENIPNVTSAYATATTNIQGVYGPDYDTAISILGNKDQFDFNVIYAPGLTSKNANSQVNSLLQLASGRGDNIAVVDLVGYQQNIGTVTNEAISFDNSYGATYWPWIQIRSSETGRMNFIPASTIVPSVYEYNDKVSAEWFAPAGLNRGGLSTVLQPERRLSINDRNTLYAAKVNPIATFAGVGTVIYGQKTLQAKPSALDRVNVRRLLISLKRYIGQIGQTLVFEPNTQVTRNKFLNQVNPYLESVQQRQGLYAFQVIMDESNNTPDTIDRNILIGSIYLQPTRVAEFIQLDFNIMPTGATFAQ